MIPTATRSRQLWEALEPLHAVTYFHPGPARAAAELGLKGWWMGYVASRAAPMGAVAPGPVTATFFTFHPRRIERALPDAWAIASPATVLAERTRATGAALSESLADAPGSVTAVDELVELLSVAVEGCRVDGRALAAAWRAVAPSGDRHQRLWTLASTLREHRGDGHVLACTAAGLTGLEATISHVATGTVTRELIQPNRGWSDEQWHDATRSLRARGLLDRDGRLTRTGGALRRALEDTTDRLAAGPVEQLGPVGVDRLTELAAPLSRHLVDTGVVPVPNPIGSPRP